MSSDWLKNKGATINPKNKDNECFKYAIIAALHHQEIERNPQRISKLKPSVNRYNWKDIEFPSYSKDWGKFEQNNKSIALNISLTPYNTKQIRPAYVSKYNNERDIQVNLLMITDNNNNDNNNNNNNWHYLAVKSISGLLKEITSKHKGEFYCLNCFHSYTTEKKLKKHERICKYQDF